MILQAWDPVLIKGIIRNAQTTPVFFPGWVLQVYLSIELHHKYPALNRILAKLHTLDAEVVFCKYIN